MNKCILIKDTDVFLSSNLNETGFGRSDYSSLLTAPGFCATVLKDGNVELEQWKFEKTTVMEDSIVAFNGSWNKAANAKYFTDLLEQNNKAAECAVLKVLSKIIEESEFSSPEKIVLPGAGGILVSENDSTYYVLVINGVLLNQCLAGSKDYAELHGKYIRRGLEGLEAALFTRAVIAYKTASEKLPFDEANNEKRQADICDSNYVPCQFAARGIDPQLGQAIESGLELKMPKRIIPGERRFINEKETQEREKLLEQARSLKIEQLEAFTPQQQDEAFVAGREKFMKRKNRIVAVSRLYRRNSKRIWTTVAAVLVALYAVLSFNKENQRLATSLGLTSEQTVHTLYTGIHKADVTIIQEITKGKEMKGLIQKVSGFYVTNKQRIAMDERDGTFTPAQWLFFKGTTNFWQYGITDFVLDGQQKTTDFAFPRRMDKNKPLTEENGNILKKGNEAVHTVSYNLVHYDADSIIQVLKVTEKVTLRWDGKRWIVRSITGKPKSFSYKTKDYKADYTAAIEQTDGNVKAACALLRSKYSFVPREDELAMEVPYMIEKYNLSAAKEF